MIAKKKKFDGTKLATKTTATMATWKFIGIFLAVCVVEIWWNNASLIPAGWQFDKTMLVLNTLLSLMAAIQGSIIMIDQRQADKKRDALLHKMHQLEQKLYNHITREETKNGKSI